MEIDNERERVRRSFKRRDIVAGIFVVVFVVVAVIFLYLIIRDISESVSVRKLEADITSKIENKIEPTVEIYDETESGSISSRIKEYVGLLEVDLQVLGAKMTRAVLPEGKVREIDFYVEGCPWYFKANIDRGTGETAEDTVRMIKYLRENEISPQSYVDVRVSGKGYFK